MDDHLMKDDERGKPRECLVCGCPGYTPEAATEQHACPSTLDGADGKKSGADGPRPAARSYHPDSLAAAIELVLGCHDRLAYAACAVKDLPEMSRAQAATDELLSTLRNLVGHAFPGGDEG